MFEIKENLDSGTNRTSVYFAWIKAFLLFLFIIVAFFCWVSIIEIRVVTFKRHFVEFFRSIYTAIQKRDEDEDPDEEQNNEGGGEGDDEDENPASNERQNEVRNEEHVPAQVRIARLYYLTFLVRRLLFAILIVVLYDASHALKMTILFIVQFIFFLIAIRVNSFEKAKDNAIERINESTYLLLMFIV